MASMATSYMATSSSSTQPVLYSPSLFPSPFFPSMSAMGSAQQPAKPLQETKHEERDELVEVGALLAVLKLVFG